MTLATSAHYADMSPIVGDSRVKHHTGFISRPVEIEWYSGVITEWVGEDRWNNSPYIDVPKNLFKGGMKRSNKQLMSYLLLKGFSNDDLIFFRVTIRSPDIIATTLSYEGDAQNLEQTDHDVWATRHAIACCRAAERSKRRDNTLS